ncbi:MAG: cupin domain-containing protein [Rhodobacteraceae bacterium]|nr:cupin domain-containing protein [Paracoccaceae bacterium]
MSRPAAIATQLIDDARVRVTRFDFVAGAEIGWHEHGYDYVITAVTECQILLEDDSGERRVTVGPGESYRRDAGIKHNVINDGDAAMSFVEVELK